MIKQFELNNGIAKLKLNGLIIKNLEIDRIEILGDNIKLGNLKIIIGSVPVLIFPCKYIIEDINLLKEFGYKILPLKNIIYHEVFLNIHYQGDVKEINLHYSEIPGEEFIEKQFPVKSIQSYYQNEETNELKLNLDWNGKTDKLIINKEIKNIEILFNNNKFNNYEIKINDKNETIINFNEEINYSIYDLTKININFKDKEKDIFIYSPVINLLNVKYGMGGLKYDFQNYTNPFLTYMKEKEYENEYEYEYNYLDYLLNNMNI
jgi:hypothetical protein